MNSNKIYIKSKKNTRNEGVGEIAGTVVVVVGWGGAGALGL
jgi:hypothetical protein